jgi:hypothetical protein
VGRPSQTPGWPTAIAKAIEEFKITDPQKQRRLIAQLERP